MTSIYHSQCDTGFTGLLPLDLDHCHCSQLHSLCCSRLSGNLNCIMTTISCIIHHLVALLVFSLTVIWAEFDPVWFLRICYSNYSGTLQHCAHHILWLSSEDNILWVQTRQGHLILKLGDLHYFIVKLHFSNLIESFSYTFLCTKS